MPGLPHHHHSLKHLDTLPTLLAAPFLAATPLPPSLQLSFSPIVEVGLSLSSLQYTCLDQVCVLIAATFCICTCIQDVCFVMTGCSPSGGWGCRHALQNESFSMCKCTACWWSPTADMYLVLCRDMDIRKSHCIKGLAPRTSKKECCASSTSQL